MGRVYDIMTLLHVLTAIFTIGPLAHAATTAARGLRHADAAATASSARMIKIYAVASTLTVVFGFGLASSKYKGTDVKVASLTEPWIWISILLWVVAAGLALFVIAPALEMATARLSKTTGPDDTDDSRPSSVAALTGRVAASGGVVGIILAVIVVLMVYRPGS